MSRNYFPFAKREESTQVRESHFASHNLVADFLYQLSPNIGLNELEAVAKGIPVPYNGHDFYRPAWEFDLQPHNFADRQLNWNQGGST